LVFAAGCSAGGSDGFEGVDEESVAEVASALGGEDGLAQAYSIFKSQFEFRKEHEVHNFSFAYNPFLSDTKVTIDQVGNVPISGRLKINYLTGVVEGTLSGPKPNTTFAARRFDVWFVRNVVGTVRPETAAQLGGTVSDKWLKVGAFGAPNSAGIQTFTRTLGLSTATGVNFDFDFVVLVPQNQTNPTTNIAASGARSLFEKRYFREKNGLTLDNPTGTRSTEVESKDTLVQRGAHLFFKEKFAGNGRTCGTCHRAEENLTINAAFISTLPASDPLFVNVPGLEDPTLIREGIVRENLDGFENPTVKFVQRSVPHTLGLSSSIGQVDTLQGFNNGPSGAGIFPDGPPPDHKTGWSSDGAPGRGTLTEFSMGAIFQHFPKADMSTGTPQPTKRVKSGASASFRLPTQEEAYSLEAFQLFSGRQRNINMAIIALNDAPSERGRNLALGAAHCVDCHRDLVGNDHLNLSFNTNIEAISGPFKTETNMPKDGGFGTLTGVTIPQSPGGVPTGGEPGTIATGFGNGQFNVPPLFEVADTGPWFHNNAIDGLVEGAVNFYNSPTFQNSVGANFVRPDFTTSPTTVIDVAAFLRTINALTNIAQVQKRTQFVSLNRQTNGANDGILRVAIEDTNDAIAVLDGPALNGTAVTQTARIFLQEVRQALQTALASADDQRSGQLTFALDRLTRAKDTLRTRTQAAVSLGMDF
jgi:cytochrome c peroxidase